MKALTRTIYRGLGLFRRMRIDKLGFENSYPRLVTSLKRLHTTDRAMHLAVGGEFEAIGRLELEILKHFGLKEEDGVVDVGCGSGRLAQPLSGYLRGPYLGIDIVPDLLDFARGITGRPDWRFEVARGLRIPQQDATADFVCFFSVFTHLLHEQSYVYLEEAKRVLKPGGNIVFSFLDFTIPQHWSIFEFCIRDLQRNSHPLNMFISKDAINVWAQRLGLKVEAIHDGDKPFIPLPEPVTFENGTVMEKSGTIGQSVCVLRKPA